MLKEIKRPSAVFLFNFTFSSLCLYLVKGVLTLKIRALEETDLDFVHHLNNEYSIMSYWFEEPYQSLSELQSLYKSIY